MYKRLLRRFKIFLAIILNNLVYAITGRIVAGLVVGRAFPDVANMRPSQWLVAGLDSPTRLHRSTISMPQELGRLNRLGTMLLNLAKVRVLRVARVTSAGSHVGIPVPQGGASWNGGYLSSPWYASKIASLKGAGRAS